LKITSPFVRLIASEPSYGWRFPRKIFWRHLRFQSTKNIFDEHRFAFLLALRQREKLMAKKKRQR